MPYRNCVEPYGPERSGRSTEAELDSEVNIQEAPSPFVQANRSLLYLRKSTTISRIASLRPGVLWTIRPAPPAEHPIGIIDAGEAGCSKSFRRSVRSRLSSGDFKKRSKSASDWSRVVPIGFHSGSIEAVAHWVSALGVWASLNEAPIGEASPRRFWNAFGV